MHKLVPLILSALKRIEEGKSIRVTLRLVVENSNITKEEESILYYYVFEIYRKLNFIDLYIKTSSSAYSLRKIGGVNRGLLRLATHLLKIENKPFSDVFQLLEQHYIGIDDLKLSFLLREIHAVSEEQLYDNRDDYPSKLSLQFYLPTWIIRKFIGQWGEGFTEALLPSLLTNPPIYVRVNTLISDPEEIKKSFINQSIIFSEVPEIENLFKIQDTPTPIPRTKEYLEGKIVIQQKASAAVSPILDPQKDDKILDMCASPGGKTSHIAALIGGNKGITAVDINDERTKILRQRLRLLEVKNIDIIQTDARELHEKFDFTFDKILVDPPCSGSGTYSSRPENRWRLKPRDLRWYVNLQDDLLHEASLLTKKNGCIVYSTCSLFYDENINIINSFLEKNNDFCLERTSPNVGIQTTTKNGIVQEVFPHIHETEGFFIAKIRRKNKD